MGEGSIRRLLVANRGEIARRVIRGAHAAGCEAVAVYAADDAQSPHVGEAETAVLLPGTTLRETYLSPGALVRAAERAGADALHPGYGFLSEDPALAEACAAAGITWVGPPPEAMRVMGHKARAKEVVAGAGVPVLPSAVVPAGAPSDELAAQRGGDRLPPAGQGVRRRRRPGDAARDRSGAAGRCRGVGAAGGPGRVRLRRGLLGALPGHSPPCRGPGGGRHPRHGAAPVRPGVLGATPAPEGRRGGARRPGGAGGPPADVGRGRRCGEGGRLRRRRHGGVPGRRERVLLLGDEHAPAGRARRHRTGHRPRPGGPAARGGVGPPRAPRTGGGRGLRPRRGGPALRRTPTGGLPADARHGHARALARGARRAHRQRHRVGERGQPGLRLAGRQADGPWRGPCGRRRAAVPRTARRRARRSRDQPRAPRRRARRRGLRARRGRRPLPRTPTGPAGRAAARRGAPAARRRGGLLPPGRARRPPAWCPCPRRAGATSATRSTRTS